MSVFSMIFTDSLNDELKHSEMFLGVHPASWTHNNTSFFVPGMHGYLRT